MEFWKWALLPVLVVAMYTDWRWQKIFNWLTFPAILVGLALAPIFGLASDGWRAMISAELSAAAGFGLMSAIFLGLVLVGGMKAGDLKLMAAVGAWLGWPEAVSALLYVAIVGGVFSVLWALAHGALRQTLRQVRLAFWGLSGGLKPSEVVVTSAAPLLPYGISIAVGTFLSMLLPPLIALGPIRL